MIAQVVVIVVSHHEKVQWQDKGHNSESHNFGVIPLFQLINVSEMIAPYKRGLVAHAVFMLLLLCLLVCFSYDCHIGEIHYPSLLYVRGSV